jgi:DNA-binding transcriptional MerR regulator
MSSSKPVQITMMPYPLNFSPITTDQAGMDDVVTYRSGAAARLIGVPVETLRVWERRYGVADPQRSAQGRRMYSAEEVRRLVLIKQLVDLGNPIGAVARLQNDQLIALHDNTQALVLAKAASPAASGRLLRVAVVGEALARRFSGFGLRSPALDVIRTCPAISGAAAALRGVAADVLAVELPEMTSPSLALMAELKEASGAQGVLVLYRFCSGRTIRQLRDAGYIVARTSSDAVEIAALCQATLATIPRLPLALTAASPLPAPQSPRWNDADLEALTKISTNVDCECPQHLAEILLTLGSFERYSAQCESRNPADAALHRDLQHTVAQARALLEDALERVVLADGLLLS